MASMEDLYQEIILDHNKRPRNFGPLPGATHKADGRNPLCGDEIQVSLTETNGRIEAIHFLGQGCAICTASASMMTEALTGQPTGKAIETAQTIIAGLAPEGEGLELEKAGDLAALSGVRQFPARIKCATLAWHAFLCAIEGGSEVSTESGEAPGS